MKILDRYILKELLAPFIFGVLAFSSIFVGTDVLFRLTRYYTQNGVSLLVITQLFFLSLPGIIVLTFPMSMLLASLLAFGRLSGNSEIVAMKAGGVNFYRLITPVLILAFLVSCATFLLNESVVPLSKHLYQVIVKTQVEKEKMPKSQENVVIRNMENNKLKRLFYAYEYNGETKALNKVTMQEFDEQARVERVMTAKKAVWEENSWYFYEGTIYYLTKDGQVSYTMQFAKEKMNLPTNPQEVLAQQKDAEEMNFKELKEQINFLQAQKQDTKEMLVEYHRRFAIPLASFVFTLIGAPLGLKPQRSGSSIGLGLSIIIIFIYYIIMTVSGALGEGGAIAPILSAWLPNLFLGLSGLYLLKRAAR